MAAAEGAGPVPYHGGIPRRRHLRHLVVDRHGCAERDVPHGSLIRDVGPPSPMAYGRSSRQYHGLEEVVFRIAVVALAEEERVAAAIGDIRQANAAVNEEDAVPRHSRKIRRTARLNRPL